MINAGDAALKRDWRYHELDTDSKGTKLLSYDPSRAQGQRWQLVSINGKPPSPAAKKRWMKSQAKQGGRNAVDTAKHKPKDNKSGSGESVKLDMTELMQKSEYKQLPSKGDTLVYQIRPRVLPGQSKMIRIMLKHTLMRLVVNRSDHRPLSLDWYAAKSFSPHFAVTINKFHTKVTYARIVKDGPIVKTMVHSVVKGKAFWVKHINQDQTSKFSDFSPVSGTVATAAPAKP